MSKDSVPYRRPYRFVMAILLLVVPFCTMVPYVAPAVFMGDIMTSFGVDAGLAGLSMTIQLGATGVCMFIGSFIQDRLGVRKSIILSIWAMVVGNAAACFAPGIAVFLLARLISGFGQGLYTVAMTPCITLWFDGKERTYMITFNNTVNSIFLAIAYSIGRPLCNLLGSWQRVLGAYAIVIVVVAIFWTVFAKDSPEETTIAQPAAGIKQESSLLRAMKEPEYWKLAVFAATFMVANTSIAMPL